jgi:hypothetical protein
MEVEEKLPYYMESLCRSLGIKTEEDLNSLLALFDKKNKAPIEEVKLEDEEDENFQNEEIENSTKNKQGNTLDLNTDEILMYLQEFLNEKKKKHSEQGSDSFNCSSRKCPVKYFF